MPKSSTQHNDSQGMSFIEGDMAQAFGRLQAEYNSELDRMATELNASKKNERYLRGKFLFVMVLCMVLLAVAGTSTVCCVKYYRSAESAMMAESYFRYHLQRLLDSSSKNETAAYGEKSINQHKKAIKRNRKNKNDKPAMVSPVAEPANGDANYPAGR